MCEDGCWMRYLVSFLHSLQSDLSSSLAKSSVPARSLFQIESNRTDANVPLPRQRQPTRRPLHPVSPPPTVLQREKLLRHPPLRRLAAHPAVHPALSSAAPRHTPSPSSSAAADQLDPPPPPDIPAPAHALRRLYADAVAGGRACPASGDCDGRAFQPVGAAGRECELCRPRRYLWR